MDNYFTLKLIELNAYLDSENDGDELFIKHRGKRIWPKNKKFFSTKNPIKPINERIKVENLGTFDFELWEYDNLFSSSYLGRFKMLIDDDVAPGASYDCSLTDKGKIFSNYSLKWMVELVKVPSQKIIL